MRPHPADRLETAPQSGATSFLIVKETGIRPVKYRRLEPRALRNSLRYALHGLRDAWRSQPNLRLQAYGSLGLAALALWCRLSTIEWLWLALSCGFVLFTELLNTAIEHTVDLVVGLRPDPLARRIKDVSAACVLFAASLSLLIAGLIFLPHLLSG